MASDLVLVVEDDPSLLDAMEMILTESALRVLKAKNGQEAMDLLGAATEKPKLILLDMKMPVMDGWEFARVFYGQYGRLIPILVITAAENAQKRAEEIEADGFISKPFQIDELLDKIGRFVSLRPF